MPVAVAVDVDVDVLVPDAVFVLVEVEVGVAVAVDVAVEVAEPVAVAEALNVPEAVSEPEIDCVLVLVLLAVEVEVAVGVAVDVEVAVPVELNVDVAVDVDVAVAVAVASAAPVCTNTSQRYVVAVNDTEIIDSISPASANVEVTSGTELNPFEAVTTTAPPPSVFIRTMNRIPGFVGLAITRVSPDAPLVISHIWRSAFARIVPPLPGSTIIFGPIYRSWAIRCGEILIGTFLAERGNGTKPRY